MEKEETIDRTLQEMEDYKLTLAIEKEAQLWLSRWERAEYIKIGDQYFKNCIQVLSPLVTSITIHDEMTARYKGANLSELVRKEFDRLKQERYPARQPYPLAKSNSIK